MFSEQLKKILKLIKKTGERVIIFDPSTPDDSYVLMNFDAYEDIVFKDRLLDQKKINNSVKLATSELIPPAESAVIESQSLEKLTATKSGSAVNSDNLIKTESLTEEDLTDKINCEISKCKDQEVEPYLAEENQPKKAWQIPGKVKDKAQEVA